MQKLQPARWARSALAASWLFPSPPRAPPASAFKSPPATINRPAGQLKHFACLRQYAKEACTLPLKSTQGQPRGHVSAQSVEDHDRWQRVKYCRRHQVVPRFLVAVEVLGDPDSHRRVV